MFDKPNKSDQKQTETHTFKNDNTFTPPQRCPQQCIKISSNNNNNKKGGTTTSAIAIITGNTLQLATRCIVLYHMLFYLATPRTLLPHIFHTLCRKKGGVKMKQLEWHANFWAKTHNLPAYLAPSTPSPDKNDGGCALLCCTRMWVWVGSEWVNVSH